MCSCDARDEISKLIAKRSIHASSKEALQGRSKVMIILYAHKSKPCHEYTNMMNACMYTQILH